MSFVTDICGGMQVEDKLGGKRKIAIPVECFIALEERIQSLRVSILSEGSLSRTSPILSQDVKLAVRRLLEPESGTAAVEPPDKSGAVPKQDVVLPTKEAFLHLEQLLHNLRIEVVNFAISQLDRRNRSSDTARPSHLEPSDIQASWDQFFTHPQMLLAAFRLNRQWSPLPDRWPRS